MASQTIEFQAKMFLFDLDNSAKEHWFKTDEAWEIILVTADEKSALEKKYYPTISAKVLPEMLAELLELIKKNLVQVVSDLEKTWDTKTVIKNHLQYLIAFNPQRQRS
jgi:hypothetical protein